MLAQKMENMEECLVDNMDIEYLVCNIGIKQTYYQESKFYILEVKQNKIVECRVTLDEQSTRPLRRSDALGI